MESSIDNDRGFVLIAVILLIIVVGSLMAAYSIVSRTDLSIVKSTRDSSTGFNVAEAGLNLRAAAVRAIFEDFATPSGTPPSGISGCLSGSLGTGDFACTTFNMGQSHSAITFVQPDAGNPFAVSVPPGEPFAGLSSQEYRYSVTSVARNAAQHNEAVLGMSFTSRKIPLFQFAVFFQEDLEYFNGATMNIDGPIHTNSDGYFVTQDGGQLNLGGQVTVAGQLFRGLKTKSDCGGYGGSVSVKDPTTLVALNDCSGGRHSVTNLTAWNDNIQVGFDPVAVPSPDEINSFSNGPYWMMADLRVVLRLDAAGLPDTAVSATGIEVVNNAGVSIPAATNALHNVAQCPGLIQTGGAGDSRVVGTTGPGTAGNKLRQYREYQHSAASNNYQRVLEVDVIGLLNCIHSIPALMNGHSLNETTQGGLVFFFAVSGPLSAASHNNYAVRLRNASQLQATAAGAPTVKGLTIVTDQGLNIWGHYNSGTWTPAAIISDSLYLLSSSWVDTDSELPDRWDRDGWATTVQAAVLTGIRRTGGANGAAGRDLGVDTNGGGVINVFRFNEYFRSGGPIPNFTYVGSIVSLGPPRRSESTWGPFTYYSAPNRLWSYDTRFNNPDNLPPMTPQAIQLRQRLFEREYSLQ